MEVTMCYETSEQNYCPTLCSNSIDYHFRTKTSDCQRSQVIWCHELYS